MSDLISCMEEMKSKKKSNLARIAYDQIKEAIIYAKFRPGDVLSENMLAGVLNMSRTPVREALKELAGEGLVEIMPGRGGIVTHISWQDLKEIYELRYALESLAAETAIDHIQDEEIDELERKWQGLLDDLKKGKKIEWERVSLYDNELHSLIIDRCENGRLKGIMSVLNQQTLRFQLLSAQALGDPENTVRQHLEITALLRSRDREKLIPVLRRHIEMAMENITTKSIFKRQ